MTVVLVKLPHRCVNYIVIGVSVILQMYFDITQELVILGEDRNNGDWGVEMLTNDTNVNENVPLLSGQMSFKNFRSSSGRWLSIGTQYLLKYVSGRDCEQLRIP